MSHRPNDITALGVLAGLASAMPLHDPLRGAPGLFLDGGGDYTQRTVRRSRAWPYGGEHQRPNPPPRTPKQKRKAASRAKAQAGRKAAKRNTR